MSVKENQVFAPLISNRRALHEYFVEAKLECGVVLFGTEVKSLRMGKATLQDSFARVEHGELYLLNCHIDPYDKASIVYSHEPKRDRKLLVHRRELKRLANELQQPGTTLIPLSIYWKDGRAKVELAIARGKQRFDKRDSIKRREQDREIRRAMSKRA